MRNVRRYMLTAAIGAMHRCCIADAFASAWRIKDALTSRSRSQGTCANAGHQMKKDLAALIVDAVVSLDNGLGTLSTLIGRIEDEEERKGYAKALHDVLGLLMMDFLLPIEREYPDLNPDK